MQSFVRLALVLIGLSSVIIQCTRMQPGGGGDTQESCGFRVDRVTGRRISWKNRIPIQMHIDASVPVEFIPAFQDALQLWNQKSLEIIGKKVFLPALPIRVERGTSLQDRISSLIWWDHDKWYGDRDEQARTNAYHFEDQYTEADIYINASSADNPSGFSIHAGDQPVVGQNQIDARGLFVHELGHVLGLIHRDDAPSVMATRLGFSDLDLAFKTRRVPAPVDLESLQCEY